MKKIHYGRVVLSGLVMGITFLFIEIVFEGFIHLVFGISEAQFIEKAAGQCSFGLRYYVVTFIYLFLLCCLIMWVYAALRPRFSSFLTAALVTGMLFWIFLALLVVNFINSGFFPIRAALLSLAFNLIELPTAVVVGSLVYRNP